MKYICINYKGNTICRIELKKGNIPTQLNINNHANYNTQINGLKEIDQRLFGLVVN